jgi:hypothetical protein
MMNGKNLFSSETAIPPSLLHTTDELKAYKLILLTSGKIVSASVLLKKKKLRKITVNGLTGAPLSKHMFIKISEKHLGEHKTFVNKRNNNQVRMDLFTNIFYNIL